MYTKNSFNLYYAFAYILFISSLGQIASDLYLPSLPAIQNDLNSSINSIQLSVAFYMYGYGLMQIFYGPFSDAYGRKLPLLVGLSIMMLGTFLAMHAESVYELLIGRLLQGIGGAGCNAIYKAIMRDIFPTRMLAKVSSIFAVLTVLTVAIAPLFGGFIQHYLGWRWNFLALLILTLITLTMVSLTSETNRYKDIKHINKIEIYKNLKTLFTSNIFLVAATSNLLCYGGLLCWLTAGPFLIISVLNNSAVQFGYISTLVGVSFGIGGTLNSFIVTTENTVKIVRLGFLIMLLAGLLLLLTMLIPIKTFYVISCVTLFSFGSSFVVPNAMALCLLPFKRIAGLAGALLGFIKNLGAAVMSSLIAFAPDTDQLPLSLAYIIISLTGIYCVFSYLPKNYIYKKRKLKERNH